MVSLSDLKIYPFRTLGNIILALVIIANSGYMLMVATDQVSTYINTACIVCSLFALNGIVLYMRNGGMTDIKYRVLLLVVVALSTMITCALNEEKPYSYLHFLSILIIGCYLSIKLPFQEFIRISGNVLCALTIVSVAFLAVIAFSGVPSPLGQINTAASTVNYYNYYIFFYPQLVVSGIARNQSIFWEPGLFAGFLLIGMCLEIVFRHRPSFLKLMIMTLGLISTYSTAGLMLLPILAVMAIERKAKVSKGKVVAELAMLVAFLILLLYSDMIVESLTTIAPEVFGKLSGEESTKITRMSVPIANLEIYAHSPMFGVGFAGANEMLEVVKGTYGIDSQTSTSTYLMAALGILGLVLNLIFIICIFKYREIGTVQRFLVILLFAVLLNVEPYQELAYIWILFFYLLGAVSQSPVVSDGNLGRGSR